MTDVQEALEAARASADRLARLQALTAGLAPLRDLRAVAGFVLGTGLDTLGGNTGALLLLDPDGDELEIVADAGYPGDVLASYRRFPVGAPLPASEAVRTGQPVYLESPTDRDTRYPLLASGPLVPDNAYAIVPLAVPGGAPLGVVVIGFAEARAFSDGERSFLESLAPQCAVAVERARLTEEARRGGRRMAYLAEISGSLARSLDPDVTLDQVVGLAVPRLAEWCALHLGGRTTELARVAPSDAGLDALAVLPVDKVIGSGAPELGATVLVLPLWARGRVLGTLSLGTRGRRFDDDDVAIALELAARAAVAIDTAQLFADRTEVARRLQESLLPATLPAVPGLDLGARYRAAGEGLDVGGDFYDAFPVRPGLWVLAVGDVRGQGVEAAAVTGLARHTIRSAAVAGGSPRQVLAHLNDVLLRHEAEREAGAPRSWEASEPRFLTVLLVAVELSRDGSGAVDLLICAAGHPLPLVRRASGQVAPAGVAGALVGVVADVELTEASERLEPGDALVGFTDGVVERHEGGRFMGEAGLAAAVAGAAGLNASQLAELVEATAVGFAEGQPEDDMAVLVLRVPPR